MQIGDYTISTLKVSTFALDGGAMFGIIPKPLWSRKTAADNRNRIDLAARCLLIQDGERNILVDTGMGDKWESKYRDIYKIDHETVSLKNLLQQKNLTTEDITDVILTHLHFDHAGGATKHNGDDIIPAFPNATYYVQENNWNWANNPSEKDAGSYLKEDFQPLKQHGVLELVDGPEEILPDIELVLCEGHTVGQQLPLISDGHDTLFFGADLLPTAAHIPVPWIMAYDLYPVITVKEKKKYLNRALEENWVVVLEHDPDTEAVTIARSDHGFQVDQKLTI